MYIMQEIQTTNGQTILATPQTFETRAAAESGFYTLCAYAIISQVEVHTIMVYTHEGFPIPELTKCFKHEAVPAPTPAPEPEDEGGEEEPVEEQEEEPGNG